MTPTEKEKRLLISYYAVALQDASICSNDRGLPQEELKKLSSRMNEWIETLNR